MTNRIRDASWIEPIGYGSRHGPYARGEPLIRGKPPDVCTPVISTKERSLSTEVAFNNMRFLSCFLRSPFGGKPEGKGVCSCLHRNSRVLAAEKTDDEVGVFIPNWDCFAEKVGRRKKVFSRSRSFQEEKKTVAISSSVKSPNVAAGNSPVRSTWIKCNADFIVPRSTANCNKMVAWDNTDDVEYYEEQKNRSLSSQYIKNGSIKREESRSLRMGVVVSEPRLQMCEMEFAPPARRKS